MTDTQGKPSELLPCPFCGSDATGEYSKMLGGYLPQCSRGDPCCSGRLSGSRDKAFHRWNTRATVKDSLTAQVPEGFALVPIKATPEIRAALRLGSRKDYPSDEMCNVRWAAAIAARPQRKESDNE